MLRRFTVNGNNGDKGRQKNFLWGKNIDLFFFSCFAFVFGFVFVFVFVFSEDSIFQAIQNMIYIQF